MDIVGSTAAAAGLRQNQSDLVRVVLSALDGIHQLANDQQSGITGIVVDVFQSLIDNTGAFGVQQFHVEPIIAHQLADQTELNGQHVGH